MKIFINSLLFLKACTEMIPTKVFFTKGVGKHKERLHSFEQALRDAGIEKLNIVEVSSIFPPGCRIVFKAEQHSLLQWHYKILP